mmetsp:Transcript_39769/g.80366  ORF Transcript_39769/g.80366 Transcript_39769/m.80366 type:complete len:228 (+) Transcript_39769:409-1092(+)
MLPFVFICRWSSSPRQATTPLAITETPNIAKGEARPCTCARNLVMLSWSARSVTHQPSFHSTRWTLENAISCVKALIKLTITKKSTMYLPKRRCLGRSGSGSPVRQTPARQQQGSVFHQACGAAVLSSSLTPGSSPSAASRRSRVAVSIPAVTMLMRKVMTPAVWISKMEAQPTHAKKIGVRVRLISASCSLGRKTCCRRKRLREGAGACRQASGVRALWGGDTEQP